MIKKKINIESAYLLQNNYIEDEIGDFVEFNEYNINWKYRIFR